MEGVFNIYDNYDQNPWFLLSKAELQLTSSQPGSERVGQWLKTKENLATTVNQVPTPGWENMYVNFTLYMYIGFEKARFHGVNAEQPYGGYHKGMINAKLE